MSFRRGVAAVIINGDMILAFQRSDHPSTWQLPQGGIDTGETEESALKRELMEETGISDYDILKSTGPIKYEKIFSHDGSDWEGQEHIYYLLTIPGNSEISLGSEFSSYKWMNIDNLIGKLPSFKKSAVKQALSLLLECSDL